MNKLLLMAVLVSFAVGTPRADPAVPPLVNYQGLLTDENGAAVPDGMKKLEFNLYDAPLAVNRVWGPQVFDNVPVINSRFNVILGTTDTQGRLISDAFWRESAHQGCGCWREPERRARYFLRQQILSAPFAIQANNAGHAQTALNAANAGEAENAHLLQNRNIQQLMADFRPPDYDSSWFRVTA
jgi:hypothetical protein